MIVYILGIMHKVVECDDVFNADLCHFGQIDYQNCLIKINKNMATDIKKETLCHEILHGILEHLGYSELSQDEQFVNSVSSAINQSFEIKRVGNFGDDGEEIPICYTEG